MTLLTSIFAAIICTVLWYRNDAENDMLLHIPVFMFWGASLMWLADAIFEYTKLGAEYFTPEPLDMLNDFYLDCARTCYLACNIACKGPERQNKIGTIQKQGITVRTF